MENILEPELLFFYIYVYVLYYDVGLCQLSYNNPIPHF